MPATPGVDKAQYRRLRANGVNHKQAVAMASEHPDFVIAPDTDGPGGSNRVAARVSLLADHPVPSASTSFDIPFTGLDFDTHGFWSGSAPSRFTVPAGRGGLYMVSATVAYRSVVISSGAGTSGMRSVFLMLNGTASADIVADAPHYSSSGSSTSSTVTIPLPLADGDFLICRGWADDADIPVRAGSFGALTWFAMTRVSD